MVSLPPRFLIPDRLVQAAGVAAIKALKPGEFIWRPEIAPRGPVVVVSLPEQLVHVYRNGVTIGVSTCSTGKPGNRTPTGVFTIRQISKSPMRQSDALLFDRDQTT